MGDRNRLIGSSPGNSMKLAHGQLGAPGRHSAITVVPVLWGEKDADERTLVDTEEREFTCTVQLLREASSRPDINGASTAEDGGMAPVRAGGHRGPGDQHRPWGVQHQGEFAGRAVRPP